MGIAELLADVYNTGHHCSGHKLIELSDKTGWKEINDTLASSLYNGNLKKSEIPLNMYFRTAKTLADGVLSGFDADMKWDDPRQSLRQRMLGNVYAFSGAKSLTMNAAIVSLITDEDGKIKPFNTFKAEVTELTGLYNENYLKAEYNNAIASAQIANLWAQYNDDDWLEFSTVGDDRVRDSHRKLDGIIQKKNSIFWRSHTPPLDWGCRCTIIPASAPVNPMSEQDAGVIAGELKLPPIFKNNVGESGIVFSDDMPYFQVAGNLKKLDAVKNYGLKTTGKILAQDNLPAILHMDSVGDYEKWWDDQVAARGINTTDFVVEDVFKSKIVFTGKNNSRSSKYFKYHILAKTSEKRHEYAANLVDIVSDADEIWYNDNVYSYIKFYSEGAYVVVVGEDKGALVAKTMYIIDKEFRAGQIRKGVLMQKK